MSDSELPKFESPPVVEVALTVQFEQSMDVGSAEIDALSAAWPEYELEMRPVLPSMTLDPFAESDDETGDRRLWLSAADGSRVVQVQHDRLGINWQRDTSGETYPSFVSLREALLDAWGRLIRVATVELRPEVCQVLYVNHVGAESGWYDDSDTSKILSPWRGAMSDHFLTKPVIATSYLHYHIPEPGRWLDIEFGSNRSREEPALAIYVTSRGLAATPNLDGALEVLDFAHEWIVQGFVSVTTREAHEVWGRTQ